MTAFTLPPLLPCQRANSLYLVSIATYMVEFRYEGEELLP